MVFCIFSLLFTSKEQIDGQSVTLEPGGQFELSGAPLDDIEHTDAETRSHLDQVRIGGTEGRECIVHDIACLCMSSANEHVSHAAHGLAPIRKHILGVAIRRKPIYISTRACCCAAS